MLHLTSIHRITTGMGVLAESFIRRHPHLALLFALCVVPVLSVIALFAGTTLIIVPIAYLFGWA